MKLSLNAEPQSKEECALGACNVLADVTNGHLKLVNFTGSVPQ